MPFSILQPMVAEFHPTRTNRDTAGQIRTALARPLQIIAYLVATFGRTIPVTTKIPIIYGKQNDPARRGAGKRRAAGLG